MDVLKLCFLIFFMNSRILHVVQLGSMYPSEESFRDSDSNPLLFLKKTNTQMNCS
jgi:hypothetical protein